MSKTNSPFLYYTRDGHTVRQGHIAVTPRSRVIGLKFPFAALIWNRPVGVTIVDKQTNIQHYQPIIDVTRLAQWGVYAVILLLLIYKSRRIDL